MKILLTVLCAIMVLFSGGCVVMLGGNVGPLSLIPLGVAVLNGLVLAVIFGWAKAAPGAFYTLVVLDVIVVVGLTIATFSFGASDASIYPWGFLLVAGFALKGLLTWLYLKSINQAGEA
jgi:hypothetical protein